MILDVVVTDKSGRFVPGLPWRDFSVFENNKRQHILSFEETDFGSGAPPIAARLPSLPPDTYTDQPFRPAYGPLYVIVYDLADMGHCDIKHCDLGDQMFARQQLAKFLADTPPGARFALFTVARDCHLVQGFTTDREKLLAALDVARGRQSIPWVFLYQNNYPSQPWQVLAFIAHWLEGLPGRKNVIWLASHFPLYLDLPPNMQGGTKDLGGGYKPAPGTMGGSYDEKMMREAVDATDNAGVALYPVDVSGVGFRDFVADEAARATGGRAWSSTNDLIGALREAVEAGSSYYELSYDPGSPKADGKVRRIRVDLRNPGYEASYRQFYYADSPDTPLTNDEKRQAVAAAGQIAAHHRGDTLYAWMRHGAPTAHDILFRAHFSAGPESLATSQQLASLADQPAWFAVGKTRKASDGRAPVSLRTYTISYLVLDRTAGRRSGSEVLEFAACAYDPDGKILNSIAQEAMKGQAAARDDSHQRGLFRAEQTLDVPDTAAWLRVAVRDVATDRIGTIEIPLPLPGTEPAPPAPLASPGR